MTLKRAQSNLDRADSRLRMAGVSNLGMSAIEQNGLKQIKNSPKRSGNISALGLT